MSKTNGHQVLLTTTVGSFPKSEELKRARFQLSQGKLSKADLRKLEEKATRECIQKQDAIGLDILVDGEMYRGAMSTYFAENLEGFKISGLVRSYGNRYYRKPICTGKLVRTRPITIDWWNFAQGLTQKPVKGMLTGPYTMMDWSFNEHYKNRREFCLALAGVIHEEALDLQKHGAAYIQIDEPAVSTRPEEMDLAIEAMGIVTKGLKARTITHICYGDFQAIYPKLLKMPIDQIDLELANRDYELLDFFRKTAPFTKEIGLGVLDVHSHRVEDKEKVKRGIRKALEMMPAARIFVDPDCGLKTRTAEESWQKLSVMIDAVREMREELKSPTREGVASR